MRLARLKYALAKEHPGDRRFHRSPELTSSCDVVIIGARGRQYGAQHDHRSRQPSDARTRALLQGNSIADSPPRLGYKGRGTRAGDDARLAQLERDRRIEGKERTYPMPRRDSHGALAVADEARRRCSPSFASSILGPGNSPIGRARGRRSLGCPPSSPAPMRESTLFSTC